MPPRRNQQPDIYVAKDSFVCEIDGERINVAAGERVRAGHRLLRVQAAYFEPVDTTVHYDIMPAVEQATAAPGEQR